MRAIAGAALLIAVLDLGPRLSQRSGWGALAGAMIGLGILLVVADLLGEQD